MMGFENSTKYSKASSHYDGPPSLWMISRANSNIVAFADRSKLIARCGAKSAFSSPPPSASLVAAQSAWADCFDYGGVE